MLDHNLLMLYLPFALVLALSPGPDTINVLTLSLGRGKRAGITSLFGTVAGATIHIAAAALGISAIIATSAVAFGAVKLVGAGYLVYLGVKALLSKSAPPLITEGDAVQDAFWRGFVTSVTNPKVAVFYLTALPQFINPALGSVGLQAALLGIMHATMGGAWLFVVALTAGRLRNWATASESFWKWQGKVTGAVFVAFGLRLAFARQPN